MDKIMNTFRMVIAVIWYAGTVPYFLLFTGWINLIGFGVLATLHATLLGFSKWFFNKYIVPPEMKILPPSTPENWLMDLIYKLFTKNQGLYFWLTCSALTAFITSGIFGGELTEFRLVDRAALFFPTFALALVNLWNKESIKTIFYE